MGDKKKTDPIVKPQDTHATGAETGSVTTQDTHATGGDIKLTDTHATGGTKPLDTHATSEPAN
ncbi:hypothetical protein OG887_23930 [Streptomyces sp. NBC_00053]|uniref:hypothetical protein n=1 Tax=unclassified Streptomyces TaxID=2593676 RepID=UPI000F5BAC3D|nr:MULTISPECIES: hypothetical protein [unclassified Streptomyces]WSG52625.1 hypothetical protein OHA38_24180 [Streptomyces sp. NBC_01732]WSX03261.1 hypothetical protein OG355_24210 [Streptomyces sp. NBC_00987]MCX4394764.1 hypothetical protein [Streptomyces sp. NBC_01767]MCX5102583.1 hypothetical protein [Streptomyces sp. NBC_00439]MCX5162167.1 hypothetical protein [Streptomyces sp. NBC_00305]